MEAEQLVMYRYLEEEEMLDAEPVQPDNWSADSAEHVEDPARVHVGCDGAEHDVDAELGKGGAACEDPLFAAAEDLYHRKEERIVDDRKGHSGLK